jgi:hypothetical protein
MRDLSGLSGYREVAMSILRDSRTRVREVRSTYLEVLVLLAAVAIVALIVWLVAIADSSEYTPSDRLAAALVLVNFVLVCVTMYYARQARLTAGHTRGLAESTRDMAFATRGTLEEMREARLLVTRPKLALDVHMIDPTFGVITVTNIGQGAALNVNAHLRLEFRDRSTQSRDLHIKTFLSNEKEQYLPRHPGSSEPLQMDEFAEMNDAVLLKGTMQDVYGNDLKIDDVLNVRELWTLMNRAGRRFTVDPLQKTAAELEQIRHWLEETEFRPKPAARDSYGPDEAPF